MTTDRSLLSRFCDPYRIPGRRSWFIVQPYSRGDTYLTCALMEGFRAEHGRIADDLVLVVKASHLPIARMFERHVSRIVTIEDTQLDALAEGLRHLGLRHDLAPDRAVVLHPMHMDDGRADALTRMPGFSQKHMYAQLLRLPLETPLSVPDLPEAWADEARAYAASVGMPAGRSVILMPDANSYPTVDDAFWCRLVAGLREAGWSVFTNVFGRNGGAPREPFPGTVGIRPPLGVLLPLAAHAGWVVSTLTGGMNILISARVPCRKTVVARGPEPGTTLRFNDLIELESAFPYASQATFDGLHYDIEEFEIRRAEDHATIAERIAGGRNATCERPPSPDPIARFSAETTPGDLFDRVTILEIKESLLSGASVLHNVRRELALLRASLGRDAAAPGPALAGMVAELKAVNQRAWDTNETIFKGFGDTFGDEDWTLDASSPQQLARAESMVKAFRLSQRLNRERVILKNRINALLAPGMKEEKSYDEPRFNLSETARRARDAAAAVPRTAVDTSLAAAS